MCFVLYLSVCGVEDIVYLWFSPKFHTFWQQKKFQKLSLVNLPPICNVEWCEVRNVRHCVCSVKACDDVMWRYGTWTVWSVSVSWRRTVEVSIPLQSLLTTFSAAPTKTAFMWVGLLQRSLLALFVAISLLCMCVRVYESVLVSSWYWCNCAIIIINV